MGMTAEQIADTLKMLAQSQGFYGRLIRDLGGPDSQEFKDACEQAAGLGIDSPVDLILLIEG